MGAGGKKRSLGKEVNGIVLREVDLVEEFSRSGGKGGQNVQKVETRVVLRHLPTGIVVTAQEDRTRESNRVRARRRLVAALMERERRAKLLRAAERSRERSRRAQRSGATRRALTEGKRRRALLKRGRGHWRGEG